MKKAINAHDIPKIKELKERHSRNLIKKHDLVGVGIGRKRKNGQLTDKIGIVFMVKKKLPKEEIQPDKLLPGKIEDIDCDVIEHKEFKAYSYTTKIRPAVPGYSIGHYKVTAGTFGCVCYKGSLTYILSNNHVLANSNDAIIDDPIYQPGVYDGGTSADTVAYLDSWIPITNGVNVDCAIAKVTDNSLVTSVGAWGDHITGYRDPSIDDIIYKSGRTTGDTSGTVTYVHTDVNVSYDIGSILITDCFIVDNSMSAPGDSGSVGRIDDNTAGGLLFAGDTVFTSFCYMSNVVSALGISFSNPSVRYWVGGTDNWDTNAGLKWSETSNGTGGASLPLASDAVIIESGNITVTSTPVIGSLVFTGGTLDTNDNTITISESFSTTGSNTRTLDLGTSIISCGGFSYSGSNLSLIEGTSIIKINGGGNFSGNGETFNEVQLNGTTHIVSGANNFLNLKRTNTASKTDTLTLASNQNISGTFTVTSNSATNLVHISSNVGGTRRTITANNFSINYASFKDISLAGPTTPYAPLSAQDLGSNSGISFPNPVRYWVGGTGNWSDGTNHWSLTSGGSPGQTPPGIIDNVYFDNSSYI